MPFGALDDFARVNANRFRHRDKFRNVEPTLAEFEFRYKRLALPDAPPEFRLR